MKNTHHLNKAALIISCVALCITVALMVGASSLQADFPTNDVDVLSPDHLSQTPTADYSVHEWGLVRFGEISEIATSGIGMRPVVTDPFIIDPPDVARKPVIYFHPGPEFDPTTQITATIAVEAGILREVWPTPSAGTQPILGSTFTWTPIVVEPNLFCGGELAPALADPACISLLDGGVCEAAELSVYMGSVPHCLSVGDPQIPSPVLLYNGFVTMAAPVELQVGASERALTNVSDTAVGTLWVAVEGGISVIDTLAPAEFVILASLTPTFPLCDLSALNETCHDELMQHVASALQLRGLTALEIEHFISAWRPDVLAQPYPWHVFGLFSVEAIDTHFPLTLDPLPVSTSRVLAFTVESGAGW